MATATNKSKALQAYSGFTPKLHTISVGEKKYNYLPLKLNDPNSQYGYKEPSFEIDLLCCTGITIDNKVWLLANIQDEANGNLFDLSVKEKGSDGKWGANKEKTEALIAEWKDTNNLIAIDTTGLPTLKIIASVLDQLKLLGRNKLSVPIGADESKLLPLKEKMATMLGEYVNGIRLKPDTEEYTQFLQWKNVLGFVKPVLTSDDVTKLTFKDDFDNVVESKEYILPVEGLNLPSYKTVHFNKPEEPSKSNSGSYGSNVTVHGYLKPDERLHWVIGSLRKSGVPIESDDLIGLANVLSNRKANYLYCLAMQMAGVDISLPNELITPAVKKDQPIITEVEEGAYCLATNDSNGNVTEPKPIDEKTATLERLTKLLKKKENKTLPKLQFEFKEYSVDYLTKLCKILESKTWTEQKYDLLSWIESELELNPQITKFTEEQMTTVWNAVIHNETLMDINPNQNISELKKESIQVAA